MNITTLAGTTELAEQCRIEGRAVITAAVPQAVETGLDILKNGGNAFDAAVAACLVETVALPMKCGLAGDLVALVRRAGEEPKALISIGPGSSALDEGAQLTVTGGCSVGIPGAPDGYAKLAAYGNLPLADLAASAIKYAHEGVAWTPVGVNLTRETETLLRELNGPITFLPDGNLPQPGEIFKVPGLARVLDAFVRDGADLFAGELGDKLVERVARAGGFLTKDDLFCYPAEWKNLVTHSLGNGRIIKALPDPTFGPWLVEAIALRMEDMLDPLEAYQEIMKDRSIGGGGTSVVSCADEDGNVAVVIHSNSFPEYGAGVVMEDFDLVLNNRPGRGFDLDDPNSPNAPATGRRPRTTLHAWSLETPAANYFGATPGGQNQMVWNLQTVCDLLDGEDHLGRLVTRPRWGMNRGGQLYVEKGHHHDTHPEASEVIAPLTMRSVSQVVSSPIRGNVCAAGFDPRMGAKGLADT